MRSGHAGIRRSLAHQGLSAPKKMSASASGREDDGDGKERPKRTRRNIRCCTKVMSVTNELLPPPLPLPLPPRVPLLLSAYVQMHVTGSI